MFAQVVSRKELIRCTMSRSLISSPDSFLFLRKHGDQLIQVTVQIPPEGDLASIGMKPVHGFVTDEVEFFLQPVHYEVVGREAYVPAAHEDRRTPTSKVMSLRRMQVQQPPGM